MNYKLAKELKDAGFPQERGMGYCVYDELWLEPEGKNYHERPSAYCPTLSELIEACGDEFATLVKCSCDNCKWNCYGKTRGGWDIENDCNGSSNGSTPEEAVARLWLESNKKI